MEFIAKLPCSEFITEYPRNYDEQGYFNEKKQFSVPFNVRREMRGKEDK